MNNNIKSKSRNRLESISNELYGINEQQELLKERKKELKELMADGMGTDKVYSDANGIIKRISRKPKRIYDRDRLEAELLKHKIPESAIGEIIKQSTRQIDVTEYLCVKLKRHD